MPSGPRGGKRGRAAGAGLATHGTDVAFSHPLARSAKVFAAHGLAGEERAMLAIVTTLELDPNSKNYKKPLVGKLSRAAQKYLADSGKATAFVLMNRPKDWRQGG
jgi:hypothetical protein